MKISAKLDYACRAIFELSLRWPNQNPVQALEIAQKQGIPTKFLIQILISLKQLGVIKSLRGKSGGYILAKPPAEIRFSDLLQYFGHAGESNAANRLKSQRVHVMDLVWQEIDTAVLKIMENINFEDICNRERSSGKTLIYEI